MVRKNIWMMLLSIIAVNLMITASVSAAFITSVKNDEETKEQQTTTDSDVTTDSGRIGLDEKAEIKIQPDGTADQLTDKQKSDDIVDESSETAKPYISPTDQTTSETGDIVNDDNSNDTDDNQNENSRTIWLAVQGDEIPDTDSGAPDSDSNGSEFNLNGNNLLVNIGASPGINIDEVFIASSSGIVDKILSIESNLPIKLNILGYASIDVISGSENFINGPYFDGLDVFDRLNLAVASASIMFLVRAIQILDIAFPIVDAIKIATKICALILNAALNVIINGLDISNLIINIGVTITINGHAYTLSNPIRKALIGLIKPVLNILESVITSIDIEQSKSNMIDYFQNLKNLFEKTDFRTLVKDLYTSFNMAVHAIYLVLQNKNTTEIQTWLEQFVSTSTAQNLVSKLQLYDGLFVGIRDGIFGKFDAFITYGRDSTPLRNIRAKIKSNYQAVQGQYAAIIEIKAISAGEVFDTKTIGILYDGSGENIPESSSSENLGIASSDSTTIGNTATSSTSSVFNYSN